MLLRSLKTVHNVPSFEELRRWTAIALEEIESVINGGLEFVQNLKSQIIDINFAQANVTFVVSHSLGKVPVGYIVIGQSVAMIVYDGPKQNWSENSIGLKSSVVGIAKILIF